MILFSSKGERPDPDKMSGGDLDGDQYLVIYDPNILQFSVELNPCSLKQIFMDGKPLYHIFDVGGLCFVSTGAL